MLATIEVYDERPGHAAVFRRRLDLQLTATTAAEIIRLRVTAEVDAMNAEIAGVASNTHEHAVVASKSEEMLNGVRPAFGPRLGLSVPPRQLDVEAEVAKALEAFTRNAFFMFINDLQVTALDQEIDIRRPVRATFLRLVPLVGG
jgi:hypothetical protein